MRCSGFGERLTVLEKLSEERIALVDFSIAYTRDTSGQLRLAPISQIIRVEADAEYVRRDETGLGGAHRDNTDQDTVRGSQNPSFPATSAHEDGGNDR
jgi:hypothetical protein